MARGKSDRSADYPRRPKAEQAATRRGRASCSSIAGLGEPRPRDCICVKPEAKLVGSGYGEPMARRAMQFELLGFDVRLFESSSATRFSVQEWRAHPGAGGIPVHLHHHTDEGFYVVAGEIALLIDDEQTICGPGSYHAVEAGQRHTFWNPAQQPGVYLTIMSPGGFEQYLAELADGLRDAQTEDEVTALRKRLGEGYDITVVGPPPV